MTRRRNNSSRKFCNKSSCRGSITGQRSENREQRAEVQIDFSFSVFQLFSFLSLMARTDTYMMTDEELRLRRLKRRRVIIILIALAAVIVAVVFGGRPTSNAIKAWQARRHADKAFAFIEQEKWMDARDEAVAAYQLRPNEPQALRAVARFLSRTRQPEALDFWKQLQNRQPLTREDRRDEVAVALAANDLSTAERALNDLLTRKDSPPAAADWILAAQVAQQKVRMMRSRSSRKKCWMIPARMSGASFKRRCLRSRWRCAKIWARRQRNRPGRE